LVCKSCLEKAFERYKAHGLDDDTAMFMAKKLIKRIERRQNRGKLHWFSRINWLATIRWRKLIGKGGNSPYDYSQELVCPAGSCRTGVSCTVVSQCRACPHGTCPDPLPNSYLSEYGTTCIMSGGCTCTPPVPSICAGTPGACIPHYDDGYCHYTCNAGYYWNGVACVPIPAVAPRGDGLTWTT